MTSRTRIAASLVVLAVIAPGGASAGGAWTKQTISNRNLAAVSFPTPQRGWAVGTGGSVVATTNGGATWSAQTSGTSSDLRGVDFVDAARGWVVGLSDTVLSTSNGGATWKASTTGTGLNLVAVDFVDATHGWAVGYTASLVQMIVSTKDGGTTWTSQQAPAGIGLLAISFADRLRGFTVGYLGAAYRTEDGGQTWLPMHVKADVGADLTSDSFYAVVRMSADEGLVAGFRGQVARTEDGGLTWQVTGTLPNPVRSLAASGDAAFAVGDGGLVAESTDAGKTWRLGASGTTLNLTGVSAPSPNRAFAVGAAGIGLAFVGEGAAATPLQMGLDPEICDGITKDWGTDAAGFVVPTITLDPTGNGDRAIVIGGTEGVRALRPFRPTAEATLWKLELQASFQRLAVAELDGDEGDELIAATAAPNAAARSGVTAVDGATGEALWSRRLPDGSRGVRTSDLDGYGIDDVVAWSEDKAIYTLSGTNGSDLRAPKPVGERVRDLRLGHLNGDGVRDIVAALHDGRVLALSGATGGPLWSHQVPRGELRGATLRDLSGDGIPEAIVAGAGESRSVTPGNGDSVTTVGNIRGALVAVLDGRDGTLIWDYRQPGTVNFNAVTTADLNGDGVHDVIGQVSRLDNSHVLALDGRGRSVNAVGTPEPLVLWTYSTARPGASPLQQASTPDALTVADGSGDGTPDVYAGLWSGGPFAVDGTPPAPDPDPAIRAPRAAGLWEVADRGIAYGVSVERFDGRLLILSSVSDGLVTLRDAGSGQVAWAYDAGIFPSIALGDLDGSPGRDVGVASVSGRLSAVDPAGRLR
ncbi:MAG TPA: YCF48-related protein, partial [Actinomycetota bacterium]|nr:YCF48-related protein [Actinomycetota bacterium]